MVIKKALPVADLPEQDLINRISAVCEAKGISKTAFGRLAVRSPVLVFEMESGRELRRDTRRRVEDFINHAEKYGASNWPPQADVTETRTDRSTAGAA